MPRAPEGYQLLYECLRRWFSPAQDRDHKKAVDGIGHVITIGAATAAGTAAIVTFLQATGTTKVDVIYWVYIPGVLLPIGALVLMNFFRTDRTTKPRAYFNRQTLVAVRLEFVIAIAILAAVVGFGRVGMIPGQQPARPKQFKFTSATVYKWQNLPFPNGIMASFPVSREEYPDGYPVEFKFQLSLKPELRKDWGLGKAVLNKANTGEKEIPLQSIVNYPNAISEDDFTAVFDQAPSDKDVYRVDVFLYAEKPIPERIEEAIKHIMDGSGIKAESPVGP